jgi:hypothetical protein
MRAIPFRSALSPAVLALVSAALTSPGFAQTADKPTVNVGDAWFYAQTSDTGKETKEVNWTRRVVAVGADGYEAQVGDRVFRFDPSGNVVDPKGAEYHRMTYRFPMQVGAEWTYTAKFGTQVLMEQRGSYKVVAFESLTVPAGTFDCFKVEGKADAAYKASYQQQVRETYWYCPKVNGVAKLSRETTVTSRDSPSSREKVEQVLTKYAAKG